MTTGMIYSREKDAGRHLTLTLTNSNSSLVRFPTKLFHVILLLTFLWLRTWIYFYAVNDGWILNFFFLCQCFHLCLFTKFEILNLHKKLLVTGGHKSVIFCGSFSKANHKLKLLFKSFFSLFKSFQIVNHYWKNIQYIVLFVSNVHGRHYFCSKFSRFIYEIS